ncbi:hypothetical protein [Pseudonocardia sp.]|uniref:hypothetical protein n=1 Tax=Pseudonocardia sp. TaxID=60912 RepID=UPI003D1366D5
MITGQVTATLGADWGPIGTQLSAWFALAGVIVATVGGVFAFGSFRRQGKQLRELELDKRAEQASKIAVWIEGDGWNGAKYVVRNASDVPALSVQLFAMTYANHPYGRVDVDVLPPGERSYPIDGDVEFDNKGIPKSVAGIIFADSVGRMWMRWGLAPLVELNLDQLQELDVMLAKYLVSPDGSELPFRQFYLRHWEVPPAFGAYSGLPSEDEAQRGSRAHPDR